jgi:hypothetical protein
MDKPNIYIITRFKSNPFTNEEEKGSTVGFYLDAKVAQEKVEQNCCDLNEAGYYPFIVIEEFSSGIHKESWNTSLFKFSREENKYKPAKFSKNKFPITNFAMG